MCRCCVCYTLVRMSVCVYMYMVSEGSVYISMYLNKHAPHARDWERLNRDGTVS